MESERGRFRDESGEKRRRYESRMIKDHAGSTPLPVYERTGPKKDHVEWNSHCLVWQDAVDAAAKSDQGFIRGIVLSCAAMVWTTRTDYVVDSIERNPRTHNVEYSHPGLVEFLNRLELSVSSELVRDGVSAWGEAVIAAANSTTGEVRDIVLTCYNMMHTTHEGNIMEAIEDSPWAADIRSDWRPIRYMMSKGPGSRTISEDFGSEGQR